MFTFGILARTYSTPLCQFIRLYGAKVNSSSSTTARSPVTLRKVSRDGQTSDGGSSVQTFKATTCEDHRNVLCYAVLLLICEEGAASEKESEN